MSYPTFSFGRTCGPKFQRFYVTGNQQIGTHLNIHPFQLEVCAGFQTFQSELSVV